MDVTRAFAEKMAQAYMGREDEALTMLQREWAAAQARQMDRWFMAVVECAESYPMREAAG